MTKKAPEEPEVFFLTSRNRLTQAVREFAMHSGYTDVHADEYANEVVRGFYRFISVPSARVAEAAMMWRGGRE